ncbi:hypothetical protein EDD85DRAFT_785242 [Armillaria nabsnona]|nr:hypothetical protein EDD85DRAFT_785242 [Armillaria nabsnona]
MDDDSDNVLSYSHQVNLKDFCSNLIGARAYTARYFDITLMYTVPRDEIFQALEKAHLYLDAHRDTLQELQVLDSWYGLALHGQIGRLVHSLPVDQCVTKWEQWTLTNKEQQRNTARWSISCMVHIAFQRGTLGLFAVRFCLPHDISKLQLCKMIRVPQPPKEPSFMSPSKKQVSVVLPVQGSTMSPPLTRKHQREQEVPLVTSTPKTNMRGKPTRHSALKKKEVPMPSKSKGTIKKPVLMDPSSNSDPGSAPDGEEYDADSGTAVFGDEDEESDEVMVPPVKRFWKMTVDESSPPPPHAYHPLTGEPLSGLLYVPLTAPAAPAPLLPPAELSSKAKGKERAVAPSSPVSPSVRNRAVRNKMSLPCSSRDRHRANRSPVTSGSQVVAIATPAAFLEVAPVDNTIYMQAFHLQVNLQFHEPPSCQALEYMKLSMLPLAPDSLTNLPHLATIVLCLGTLRSASLTATSPCSARWDANQLRHAATLLDPLTLSSDGAIHRGIDHVERINAEIALLGRAMHCLCEDCDKIVGELADGLNAIASHEHGTEIINAYAQISDFLKSFIIQLGDTDGVSDAEGEVSESGPT